MKPRPAQRIARLAPTIFTEFTLLAQKSGAVNLGQGFPDFDGPEEIKEAAIAAIRAGVNQYAAGPGAPELRRAISAHAERFYGQKVDPDTMITVTSGATEALFDALLGLVDPGDEVVLFEPFYDSYMAGIELAGGVAKPVQLRPPDSSHPERFWFDPEELRAAFSPKTKLVVLNTPHNPTGKVFTRAELEQLAALCEEHDVLAMTDEVYEHLAYAPAKHIRLATLPGMAERTLTISSAGKTLALTGWKIGWAIGPRELRGALQSVHQYVTFATSAPMQAAVAKALMLPDSFFSSLAVDYARRRDFLTAALKHAGLPVLPSEGAYFVLADPAGKTPFAGDFEFCRYLTEKTGVAAIPITAFYTAEHARLAKPLARFAFCKKDETLAEAARRLTSLIS
jgi:N-succinyldiaminopimelate aminotransferase